MEYGVETIAMQSVARKGPLNFPSIEAMGQTHGHIASPSAWRFARLKKMIHVRLELAEYNFFFETCVLRAAA